MCVCVAKRKTTVLSACEIKKEKHRKTKKKLKTEIKKGSHQTHTHIGSNSPMSTHAHKKKEQWERRIKRQSAPFDSGEGEYAIYTKKKSLPGENLYLENRCKGKKIVNRRFTPTSIEGAGDGKLIKRGHSEQGASDGVRKRTITEANQGEERSRKERCTISWRKKGGFLIRSLPFRCVVFFFTCVISSKTR